MTLVVLRQTLYMDSGHQGSAGINRGNQAYWRALLCNTLNCTALHWHAYYRTIMHCNTIHCTAQHCTALHWTVLNCKYTKLYGILQYYKWMHWNSLHCTALHGTTLLCTVMGWIIVHYTPMHCTAPHRIHCTWLNRTALHHSTQQQFHRKNYVKVLRLPPDLVKK